MNLNDGFLCLDEALPADIARRKGMGDLTGAMDLIDKYLAQDLLPDLAPRLRAERVRLERMGRDFTLDREAALAELRAEWPDATEADFDRLVTDRRIDWRCIDGQPWYHDRFLSSVRIYPAEAPGLAQTPVDNSYRDGVLARMEAQGSLTARITLTARIKALVPTEGKVVRAWLPIPAACPQQSDIQLLDFSPGGMAAPETAPQRTIYWESNRVGEFFVTYRYLHRANYVDPAAITPDAVQPVFDTGEQRPHIVFTPYLRALAARITAGCSGPVEKAAAIYDYVTGQVDYRYQPAYIQLDSIADTCAKELRGDCGVFALLFITLCRICGIPARWQSGLAVRPDDGAGCHDWAMFYIAPHGWLWADCSYGASARRNGETRRRAHYFGSLDPWRMVANSVFQAPLTPPNTAWRHDPYDNQLGELSVDGVGLAGHEMERSVELVEFELV